MLDQNNNFYLISLNIFITCLQDNVGMLYINHLWKFKAGLILHINYLGDGKNIYIFTVVTNWKTSVNFALIVFVTPLLKSKSDFN